MADQPKSRLDREIDEILEKKSKKPIRFTSHPRVKKHRGPSQTNSVFKKLEAGLHWLLQMPLILAFVFAIFADLVNDASPLLSLVFSAATVITLYLPGILALTKPTGSSQSEVKYWRGTAYTQKAKSAVSRHPVDTLKRYFDRNR